jgi:hypothetical protein
MGKTEISTNTCAQVIHEPVRGATLPAMSMQKPRGVWEKLGVYNIIILFTGTIAIFLALSILAILWVDSSNAIRGGSFSPLWYHVVDNRWMTRVVTLSSVAIRVASAAQLGVFAAILAALILERVGVYSQDLPLISMIRCLNSGPHSLALSILRSVFAGTMFPYFILIALAVLNAAALQFTSTILLTDFLPADVVIYTNMTDQAYGLSNNSLVAKSTLQGTDYWKTGPTLYPRFAEYSETPSQQAEYTDTGKSYRGFIPFRDTADRRSLQNYSGPMTIMDSRVICVSPTISDLRMMIRDQESQVVGTYSWKGIHPDLTQIEESGSTFNCTVPNPINPEENNEWPISLCVLSGRFGSLRHGNKIDGGETTYDSSI